MRPGAWASDPPEWVRGIVTGALSYDPIKRRSCPKKIVAGRPLKYSAESMAG